MEIGSISTLRESPATSPRNPGVAGPNKETNDAFLRHL